VSYGMFRRKVYGRDCYAPKGTLLVLYWWLGDIIGCGD
jgi:hypothetical protein